MLTLDFKKAQELVAEAIAAKGADFVYEKEGSSCKYVHGIDRVWDEEEECYIDSGFENAVPGCLVGDALKRGGIPIEVLGGEYVNDSGSDELLSTLQDKDFVRVSDRAREYLGDLQASQDSGAAWGVADEKARQGIQFVPVFDGDNKKTGELRECVFEDRGDLSDVPH
ncbi:hypothetical protein SEA_OLICIOUS_76 [Streptomyces phage Olicious]|uniref:Uncharacterized protein n=1 Tax=Streptomyces phage Olicious TaxID=2488981 RepID=A0A3G8FM82_9CAUD|nr:hypothetical protein SEA_OLICIOUS_76 [Streptomyces phage Olicious]